MGGFAKNQKILAACEKFNTKTGETSSLGLLNSPTASSCVTSFNKKYIFKFGGIGEGHLLTTEIEKYDFQSKNWQIIDPKLEISEFSTNFELLSTAACVQINSKSYITF